MGIFTLFRRHSEISRLFQVKFHFSNRLAHPAADGLFGASVAQSYFRARFAGDEPGDQHVSQVSCQSLERPVDVQFKQRLLLCSQRVQIRQHVRQYDLVTVLSRKRFVERGELLVCDGSGSLRPSMGVAPDVRGRGH